MAMIDDAIVSVPGATPEDGVTIDDIKQAIARQAWGWFYVHQGDVVFSHKVFFWTINVHVRDLRPLFVKLFGEQ
jgi:hypothetical protein